MRNHIEHQIRGAAGLARPGWVWAAALMMNAPVVGGAALLVWFAWTAYEPTLRAVAGVLAFLAVSWVLLLTVDSWRVLRRFSRREGQQRSREA